MSEKIKTLQECKDEVAQSEGYSSWDWIIAEYPANTKSDKSVEQMHEKACEIYVSQFKSSPNQLEKEIEELKRESLVREEYIGELREAIYYPEKSLIPVVQKLEQSNAELLEALKLLDYSIAFTETEHNANYVITTEDKKIIKSAIQKHS
jgi:hypothetical protein